MDSGSCDHRSGGGCLRSWIGGHVIRLGGGCIRSWIVGHVITDWVGDALDHG